MHRNVRLRRAGFIWRVILDWAGADALTMPWGVIHVRASAFDDLELRIHELVHIAQIERDGAWRWTRRYLWDLYVHGYEWMPYEIEARNIAQVVAERSHGRIGEVEYLTNEVRSEMQSGNYAVYHGVKWVYV